MNGAHPTAVTYKHGGWTTQNLDGDAGFSAISCVSKSFCVAVEANDYLTFNGSKWSPAQVVSTTAPTDLTGVSCVSTSFCVAFSL